MGLEVEVAVVLEHFDLLNLIYGGVPAEDLEFPS